MCEFAAIDYWHTQKCFLKRVDQKCCCVGEWQNRKGGYAKWNYEENHNIASNQGYKSPFTLQWYRLCGSLRSWWPTYQQTTVASHSTCWLTVWLCKLLLNVCTNEDWCYQGQAYECILKSEFKICKIQTLKQNDF